jgi:hypothetical protein
MNTLYLTCVALCALIAVASSEPFDYDEEYATCACFEDDGSVAEYGRAFNALHVATKRFAMHMDDSRFDEDTLIRSLEFNNYFKSVNESLFTMNNTLTQLNLNLDTFAKINYDWMLVITGYVIKREFESLTSVINLGF